MIEFNSRGGQGHSHQQPTAEEALAEPLVFGSSPRLALLTEVC